VRFFGRKRNGAPLPSPSPDGGGGDGVAGPAETLRSAEERAEDRRQLVRKRMLLVGAGLCVGVVLVSARAFILQTGEKVALEYEAAQNYVRTSSLDRWRGDVRDRNGSLLALSVHRWAVTLDPEKVKDPALTAQVLGSLLGVEESSIAVKIGDEEAMLQAIDRAGADNPTARAARRLVRAEAEAVATTFGVPIKKMETRLKLLSQFHQMEQLQFPGLSGLVDIIARVAEDTGDTFNAENKYQFMERRGRRFAYIARDVDDVHARAVAEARDKYNDMCRLERSKGNKDCHNPLATVRIVTEPKRYYPKRELLTQVVGLVGPDDKGISGVERAMNSLLSGGEHRIRKIRDRRGRGIYLDGVPDDIRFTANSIELAFDEKIQAFAESALSEACMVAGARAGFAVVMRVKTGEVLAAANFPTFNPNTYAEWFRDRQPLLNERRAFNQAAEDLTWAAKSPLTQRAFPDNYETVVLEAQDALSQETDAYIEYAHAYPDATRATAFLDVYEPGSITKVFTFAAGVEEGVVDLDTEFDLENGELELQDPDDTRIRDTSRYERGKLPLCMKKSSNICAAKTGFRLGAEKLERYYRAWGFGGRSGSGFPGEAPGLLLPASKWTIVHLANISFGQGFAATGIQLARATAALGNGGKLMKPIVVRRVLDSEGKAIKTFEPEVIRQVVSPRTARTVLDLMRGVVAPDGTGKRAHIPEYPVAGKTGTGQKSHLRKRGYAEDMWVATFLGLAPADDPELAVVVLVDEPKGKAHGGGTFAAPAFKRIMRWSLRYLGVPSPYDTGKRVAWIDPAELKRRRNAQTEEEKDKALEALKPPVDPSAVGAVQVPDFRGLTKDVVRKRAFEAGLTVRYMGSGVAVGQDVEPHTQVPAWSQIAVSFKPRAPRPKAPSTAGTPGVAP